MLPYFSEQYGNSGSAGHTFGETASAAVQRSRETIAACLGAKSSEIVFTSGATESNNLAIRGVGERRSRGHAEQKNNRRGHLISVRTEHQAVLDPLRRLAKHNFEVTLLEVETHGNSRAGWLDPQKVADSLCDDTVLVSVMLANNEIGAIQPLAEIGALCRLRGALLHCDATQAVGKISIDMRQLPIDLMSFSAHKIYGPKGVGSLFVRSSNPIVRLEPQITGGGQQGGRRSGTLNTPGIVGLAKALELCVGELSAESQRLASLRNRLWQGLASRLGHLQLCGPALDALDEAGRPLRLPGNLNVSFGHGRRLGAEQPSFWAGPIQYQGGRGAGHQYCRHRGRKVAKTGLRLSWLPIYREWAAKHRKMAPLAISSTFLDPRFGIVY
jgi:cysteine desulfurase